MTIKHSFFLFIVLLFASCKFSPEKESVGPFIHFTADLVKEGKPVSLIHDGKEYHLFFQGKPESSNSNSMKWGHVISTDLIHWSKSSLISFPDSVGIINSGSIVMDWNNTSGFGKDGIVPMVAFYQYSDSRNSNVQSLSYSLDKGKTWIKYSEHPIELNTGSLNYRISKIVWHEESQKWIMVVTGTDHVRFYSSENLIDWQLNSTFAYAIDAFSGEWDYADFFPLIPEGSNETKWILLISYNSSNPSSGAGTKCIVGDFDGYNFRPAPEKVKSIDYGRDNFAGATCALNNERIFIGCINNSLESNFSDSANWKNSFTLPRKLSLSNNFNGFIVKSEPFEELTQLRDDKKLIAGTNLNGMLNINQKQELPYEINLTFNIDKLQWVNFAEKFGIELSDEKGNKLEVAYDHDFRVFYINRVTAGVNSGTTIEPDYAPYIAIQKTLNFRIIVDQSSVELFAGEGSVVMTERIAPDMVLNQLKLFAQGGDITLQEGNVYSLKK